jgi:hypothetical protein
MTSDLDLLARRSDLEGLEDALHQLGYQPLQGQRPLAATVRHRMYGSPAGGWNGTVEVHVELAEWDSRGWMDRLWGRVAPQTWEGMPVLTLASPDHVLLLCVHAANHGWMHFCHLVDLAQALQLEGSRLDWEAFAEEARLAGLAATAFYSLQLAETVCCAPLPSHVVELLCPGWLHRHLLEGWVDRRGLIRPRESLADGPYSTLLQIALQDGGGRRLHLLATRVWPPGTWLPAGENRVGLRLLRLARKGVRLVAQFASAGIRPNREGWPDRVRAKKRERARTP